MIDRYVVLAVTGQDAQGVVYTAYDPELDRKIALRVIGRRPAMENVSHDWLAREAQAMARISNQNVVTVYDAGSYGSELFVAMELVEGKTLRDCLHERPLPVAAVLELFLAAGKGLAAVHRAGLVHCDFKPDNVLVAEDGRVRVTDFALARIDGDPDRRVVEGASAYLAPEQLEGAIADARSDQFSFCVALYEAVFGERPFKGDSPEALGRAIVAGMVQPAYPPRGSARLLAILQRGLRADPAERFADMEALLAALARDPVRRWQRIAALFLLGLLVAGLSIGINHRFLSSRRDCGRVGDALAGIWDSARREAIHSVFLSLHLPGKERLWERVATGLDSYVNEWLSQRRATCEAANTQFGSSDALIARKNLCLGRRLSTLRELSDLFAASTPAVIEHAQIAVVELPSLRDCEGEEKLQIRGGTSSGPTNPDDARLSAELMRVRMLRATGLDKEAVSLGDGVLREAEARKSSLLAEALYRVGSLHSRIGETTNEVVEELRRSALLADEAHEDEIRVLALVSLVFFMSELRSPTNLELGHRYAEEADAVLKRIGGSPRTELHLLSNLATLLQNEQRNEEALAQYKRALALWDSLPPTERDDIAKSMLLNNLAALYGHMHRFEEALPYARQACSIREEVYGPDSAVNVNPLHTLGEALRNTGQYAEAQTYYERALALQRRVVGTESRRVVFLLSDLATTLSARGKLERARSLYLEALAMAEKVLDRTDPVWMGPLLGLGNLHLKLDQPQQAVAYLERAFSITKAALAPGDLAELQFALARALAAAGRDARRVDELAAAAKQTYATNKWDRELAEVETFLKDREKRKPTR